MRSITLHCNVCGEIFEAPLPDDLVNDGVGTGRLYSYSAHSTVVLFKYLGVVPWHRQQAPSKVPWGLGMGHAASTHAVTVCPVYWKHPLELAPLLDAYHRAYKNDAHTRAEDMSDEVRLAYHRQHSRPILMKMCHDAQALLDKHKVEPNSKLGSALDYLLNH